MSTDLHCDADMVQVTPWCAIHDIALTHISGHPPLSEGAIENTWVIDLSGHTCASHDGSDKDFEEHANAMHMKVEMQLRGGQLLVTPSPEIPPDMLFGINPKED